MKPSERLLRWMGQQARKPSGLLGQMAGHGMSWGHRSHTAWVLGYLDVQPADRVLDIGCGGGMAIKLIAKVAVDGFVAGLDHSPGMVEQARRRNAAAIRAGRVEIVLGDVVALPYDDASFDTVISVQTFYFWLDPIQSLREVRRVLRGRSAETGTGGLVALTMEVSKESRHWPNVVAQADRMGCPIYSGTEMVELLTAAGFSRAWFEFAPDKGVGWLCALARK
jgi:ubiquinone/menaquinone biosynthesis C-methylase UbiE